MYAPWVNPLVISYWVLEKGPKRQTQGQHGPEMKVMKHICRLKLLEYRK